MQGSVSHAGPAEPDLFGFVRVPVVRPRMARKSNYVEGRLDKLQQRHREILDDLRRNIESALEVFAMAMVDHQDGENAGDIDRLIEELDEEITDALRSARGEVFW